MCGSCCTYSVSKRRVQGSCDAGDGGAACRRKTGDLRTWTRTCLHCVKYHLCDGNKKAAKALLVKITALVRSACTKEDSPLDSTVCWAQLELLLARLDAAEAHEKQEPTKDAVARIHRVLHAFDGVSGGAEPHPLYLDAIGFLARLQSGDEALETMERGLKGASQLYAASWPSNDTQTSRLISPPIARRCASLSSP